jgi:hypothetical protein
MMILKFKGGRNGGTQVDEKGTGEGAPQGTPYQEDSGLVKTWNSSVFAEAANGNRALKRKARAVGAGRKGNFCPDTVGFSLNSFFQVKGLEARPRTSKGRATCDWKPHVPRRRTARGRTSGPFCFPARQMPGPDEKSFPRGVGGGTPTHAPVSTRRFYLSQANKQCRKHGTGQ